MRITTNTKRRTTRVATILMLSAAFACGGDDHALPGVDFGMADPSATRSGPIRRSGAPDVSGEDDATQGAPYRAGDRVDLGGADIILAGAPGTQSGIWVAMPGDMDGDGFADVAVASSMWRTSGMTRQIAVSLVYGGADLDPERLLLDAETTLVSPSVGFGGVDQPWIVPAGDVDGDGLADLLIGLPGSCSDAGRVYLVYGDAVRRGGEQSLPDVAVELTNSQRCGAFGVRLAGVGDVNGDGQDDFIVVALGDDASGQTIYFYYGSHTRLRTHAPADAILRGAPGERIGVPVGAAGNVDRDQYDDFIVEADDDAGARFYLVRGDNVRWSGMVQIADIGTPATMPGGGNAAVGTVGDLDGDELDDFAAGSYGTDEAFVFGGDFTRWRTPFSTADAATVLRSPGGGFTNWTALAPAGDVNGDAHADFLIGLAADGHGRGAVQLVLGDGTRVDGTLDLATQSVAFLGRETSSASGSTSGDYAGVTVGAGGDINGDGLDDFIIGAPGVGDGRAYVVYGIAAARVTD